MILVKYFCNYLLLETKALPLHRKYDDYRFVPSQ